MAVSIPNEHYIRGLLSKHFGAIEDFHANFPTPGQQGRPGPIEVAIHAPADGATAARVRALEAEWDESAYAANGWTLRVTIHPTTRA